MDRDAGRRPGRPGDPVARRRRSLYARDGTDLVRLDPATGAVLARRPAPLNGRLTNLALMSGTLWVDPGGTGGRTAVLRGYDPETLKPAESVRLGFGRAGGALPAVPMAAAPSRAELFLGLADTVDVVDTATGRVTQFAVGDGPVIDVAIDPDGSRLYVGLRRGEARFHVDVLDAGTGARLGTVAALDDVTFGNDVGLVPSSGGLWTHVGGGSPTPSRSSKGPS